MIYLITGPDNSGKDTVIKTIQECLDKPAHVFHYSAIKGDSKKDIIDKSRKMYAEAVGMAHYASKMLDAHIIFNRFWEGEMIYGPIYRDYTKEESRYVLGLETLSPSEVKGIYVTANPKTLLEREDGLSQSENDIVKIASECTLFEEFIECSRYNFTTINTTFVNEASLLPIVRSII